MQNRQIIRETERLLLRRFSEDDWLLMLTILNDPDFVRYVGDRGVKTESAARKYLLNGPINDYDQHGFGLWIVEQKIDGQLIGGCGLLQRDYLDHPDIGFALLPHFRRQGYAFEIASAVVAYGGDELAIQTILATTHPDNKPSIRLLERLGMRFERMIAIGEANESVSLYTT